MFSAGLAFLAPPVVAGSGNTRTQVLTDNFTGTAGTFPSTNFTNLNGTNGEIRYDVNNFVNPFGNPADARAIGTFSNDQYFSVVVNGFSAGNVNDIIGGCLRLGTTTVGGTGVNGYRVKVTDGGVGARTTQLFKVVNGVETQLGATITSAWAIGDTIEGEVKGTAIKILRNGAVILSVTDSTFSTGNPGVTATQAGSGTMRGDDGFFGNIT